MPIKKITAVMAFCLAACFAHGQDFTGEWSKLREKKDSSGQRALLQRWETQRPADAEMFIAQFNYYANRSTTEVIEVEQNALGSKKIYNPEILKTGFDYIDKGLRLYPTRLDMRFGKIYMLGSAENYTEFTRYLVETIHYANSIKNAWTWKEGKALPDAPAFFLDAMQDYVATIYNTEDDALLPMMRTISETVLQYHPTHVESLSNVALTYLIEGHYSKALEFLLRAEKSAPNDVIVLNNIVQAYLRQDDKINGKIYLEKIIKTGSREEIDIAKQQLADLKK